MKDSTIKLLLGAARWAGAAKIAGPFMAGSGAILMLHRVTKQNWSPLGLNAGLSITPDFLDDVLTKLRRRGQTIVTMDEMLEAIGTRHAHQVVAITADDAYLDNLTEALPVFEAHDAPFTLYVAPGLISGEILPWWEVAEELVMARDEVRLPQQGGEILLACRTMAQKCAAGRRLMQWLAMEVPETKQQEILRQLGGNEGPQRRFMNWDELRLLGRHPLVMLGAHTVHHFALARLEKAQALEEMQESATIIAAETGIYPRHFAYPYGGKGQAGMREVELARQAGFATAVTTRHGVLIPQNARHPHALPRISINGNYQSFDDVATLLSGLTTPLANKGRRLVTV